MKRLGLMLVFGLMLVMAACNGSSTTADPVAAPTAMKASCTAGQAVDVVMTTDPGAAVVDRLALGEGAIQVGQTVDGWKYICTARLVYGWVREEACR